MGDEVYVGETGGRWEEQEEKEEAGRGNGKRAACVVGKLTCERHESCDWLRMESILLGIFPARFYDASGGCR